MKRKRDVINHYVFFKVKNVIKDYVEEGRDVIINYVEDKGVTGEGFSIMINDTWVDFCKREWMAKKKVKRIQEIVEWY